MGVSEISDTAKHWLDGISIGAIAGTFLGWLPHIAAALSVVWFIYRIRNERLEEKIKRQEYTLNERKLRGEQ
jgi:uncharacterized membrane protein YciS (DUF1049 family)